MRCCQASSPEGGGAGFMYLNASRENLVALVCVA